MEDYLILFDGVFGRGVYNDMGHRGFEVKNDMVEVVEVLISGDMFK